MPGNTPKVKGSGFVTQENTSDKATDNKENEKTNPATIPVSHNLFVPKGENIQVAKQEKTLIENMKVTTLDLKSAKKIISKLPETKEEFSQWIKAQIIITQDQLNDSITNKLKKSVVSILKIMDISLKGITIISIIGFAFFVIMLLANPHISAIILAMLIVKYAMTTITIYICSKVSGYLARDIENYRKVDKALNVVNITMLNIIESIYIDNNDDEINYKKLAKDIKLSLRDEKFTKSAKKFAQTMLSNTKYYPANNKTELLQNITNETTELMDWVINYLNSDEKLAEKMKNFAYEVQSGNTDSKIHNIINKFVNNMPDKNTIFDFINNLFKSKKADKVTNDDFNNAVIDGFKASFYKVP